MILISNDIFGKLQNNYIKKLKIQSKIMKLKSTLKNIHPIQNKTVKRGIVNKKYAIGKKKFFNK